MSNYLFAAAVLQVIWIDVILSGDNAVVIALACQALPDRTRKIGIALGVLVAIVARVIMAAAVSWLLDVPFLKIVGGLLLLYIAVKVIMSEEEAQSATKQSGRLLTAVAMIVVADATMSLDNVVAIAAVARGNDLVFVLGLLCSMPLMIVGASLISNAVARFPILVWAGGALLGWVAGGMIVTDPSVVRLSLPDWVTAGDYFAGAVGIVLVLAASFAVRIATRRPNLQTKPRSELSAG